MLVDKELFSTQSRHRMPIGGLGIDLGKPVGTGKDQQVVEVGEDPALRLRMPCVA
jgi:hypothetical protein